VRDTKLAQLAQTSRRTFKLEQRAHGPHAFTHAEWFCSKIKMFFEILLYEWPDVTRQHPTGAGEPTAESGCELAGNRKGPGDRYSDRHEPGQVK
jgi:hypothetical protein